MAREYAKNWVTMWTDEDFCTQPVFDKLLWNVLLGQPPTLLNYAGVQPLSFRRWRKAMREGHQLPSELEIKAALIRMERRRYVYTDDDTGELLARSFIRRDEVVKQPNVLLSALRATTFLESPKLAHVLLRELTERIVLPEINGTSDRAEKLRHNLKAAMKASVDHLKSLSEGLAEPLPEPFAEDFPEGLPEPFTEGLPRPAEMEPFPKGLTKPFAIGSVGVEVEVATSPSVGGYVERVDHTDTRNGHTQPPQACNEPPPETCPKHTNHPDPPKCGACAAYRKRRERWDQTSHERRATQLAQFWEQVRACPHCDEDGFIDTPTQDALTRCPHHNWNAPHA